VGTDPQPKPISIGETALKAGDRVVYPNQGVCRISGIEVKEIGGIRGEFLTMRREEDGATVMVPRSKVASIGLRSVAAREEIEQLLELLATDGEDPELDWKIRHRTNADKMVAGGVLGTAEVLKGLHTLALLRPLPQRERELYDSARHLLVHEVSVALGMSPCTAEDAIDLSLTPIAGSARAKAQADRIAAALDEQLALAEDGAAEPVEEGEGEGEGGDEPAAPPPGRAAKKAVASKPAKSKKAAKPPPPAKAAKTKPGKPKAAKAKPAKRGHK
jgi:RNA polymerase-interacting CarD/CdnL/TRCF family regulator